MLFNLQLDENHADFSRVRSMELKDGQTITMEREPEYGFVQVRFKKGRTPDILAGKFTSFAEGERAVQTYLNNKELKAA